MSTKYVRIHQLDYPDLLEFRKRAVIECSGTEDMIYYRGYHSRFKKLCEELNVSRIEDIYRFTDEKWFSTKFDHIDCHYVDDKISCISGVVDVNGWMKAAVYHFNLREYAKTHPSRLFWKGGFLDRLIDYSKLLNKKGVFISIYPHNKALQALCKKLKDGTGIPTETNNYELIRSLKYRGTHIYNHVPQDFFVLEFGVEKIDFPIKSDT